jgi:hypothetical protein
MSDANNSFAWNTFKCIVTCSVSINDIDHVNFPKADYERMKKDQLIHELAKVMESKTLFEKDDSKGIPVLTASVIILKEWELMKMLREAFVRGIEHTQKVAE